MSDDSHLQDINRALRELVSAFHALEQMLRSGVEGAEDRKGAFLQILGGLAARIERAVEILEARTSIGDRLDRCETLLRSLAIRQARQEERDGALMAAVERLTNLLDTPVDAED